MDLAAEIARFDPSVPIERASTPPSSWYTAPEFAELDRSAVLQSGWLCVGRVAQVAEAGAHVSGVIAGEPYLVVRGEDDVLRGFYNVCRHHAAALVDGAGQCARLVCPYHGWTYGLDGRLLKAPRVAGIQDFDRAALGLKPIAVRTFGPLVLIHFKRPAHTGWPELERRLDATGWADLDHAGREVFEVDCNWKVFADNYLDGGYHIATLHGDLEAGLAMDTYTTEIFDRFSIQSSEGGGSTRFTGRAIYGYVYPTLMVNRYGPALDVNIVEPLGPNRCRVIFEYWFEPGTDAGFIAESLATARRIQDEDEYASERVQRGLESSAYDRGRYAPGLEQGEHHFHRLLYADYRQRLTSIP